MFFISSYTMWWTQGILSYLPVPYDEGIWNTAISSARLWFNYILVTVTKQEFVFNALYLHSVWYFTVWIMSCTVHFVVIQFFLCVLPAACEDTMKKVKVKRVNRFDESIDIYTEFYKPYELTLFDDTFSIIMSNAARWRKHKKVCFKCAHFLHSLPLHVHIS